MVARLEKEGVEVMEVSLPTFDIALSAYYLIAPAEASRTWPASMGSDTGSGRRRHHRGIDGAQRGSGPR